MQSQNIITPAPRLSWALRGSAHGSPGLCWAPASSSSMVRTWHPHTVQGQMDTLYFQLHGGTLQILQRHSQHPKLCCRPSPNRAPPNHNPAGGLGPRCGHQTSLIQMLYPACHEGAQQLCGRSTVKPSLGDRGGSTSYLFPRVFHYCCHRVYHDFVLPAEV